MLTMRQFYLTKLIEECQEVSQRAAKSMQFGSMQVQSQDGLSSTPDKNQEKNNATRLRDEVEDLLGVINLLENETQDLSPITELEHFFRVKDKKAKILKYLKYSQELGMVEND